MPLPACEPIQLFVLPRRHFVLPPAGAGPARTTDATFDGASDESTLYGGYELLAQKLAPGTTVLLDDGLISEDEFAAGRQKILESL